MDDHYPYIGVRIVSKLKELQKTQVQLCQETGLSTTAMSAYCTGKRVPETTALLRLSKSLNVSMEWLLLGRDATNEDITLADFSVDGIPMSALEKDLIAMFRLLPEGTRKELFDLVYFKYSRLSSGEKESIYWTYFAEREDEKKGPDESHKTHGGTA